MDHAVRLKRLRFRAHHRGTREADALVGGFFDRHADHWDEASLAWFEALLDEQDVDLLAWAMRLAPVPSQWNGPMMAAFQRLDFIELPE